MSIQCKAIHAFPALHDTLTPDFKSNDVYENMQAVSSGKRSLMSVIHLSTSKSLLHLKISIILGFVVVGVTGTDAMGCQEMILEACPLAVTAESAVLSRAS